MRPSEAEFEQPTKHTHTIAEVVVGLLWHARRVGAAPLQTSLELMAPAWSSRLQLATMA